MQTTPPSHPLIYLITDRQAFRRNPEDSDTELWQRQLAAIRLAAQAGCQLIQLREKDLPARELSSFARAALREAHLFGAKVLINDRLDVALAVGADGVHLRATSLPTTEVRRALAERALRDLLLAVSTHSLAEAQAAAAAGADFIVCGPVYDTPTKRAFGQPLGIARFAEICRAVALPVLALGGIKLANYQEPLQHGAAGIAAIGLFTQSEQLPETIGTILATSLPARPGR
jgi:thiamine-phosphate pyrophosphorylase